MAKNNKIQKYSALETEDDFELFEDLSEATENEVFSGMISSLVEASNEHIKTALELTKLVIANSPDQKITEDKIFASFKKASKIVFESYPLKSLLERGLDN